MWLVSSSPSKSEKFITDFLNSLVGFSTTSFPSSSFPVQSIVFPESTQSLYGSIIRLRSLSGAASKIRLKRWMMSFTKSVCLMSSGIDSATRAVGCSTIESTLLTKKYETSDSIVICPSVTTTDTCNSSPASITISVKYGANVGVNGAGIKYSGEVYVPCGVSIRT